MPRHPAPASQDSQPASASQPAGRRGRPPASQPASEIHIPPHSSHLHHLLILLILVLIILILIPLILLILLVLIILVLILLILLFILLIILIIKALLKRLVHSCEAFWHAFFYGS